MSPSDNICHAQCGPETRQERHIMDKEQIKKALQDSLRATRERAIAYEDRKWAEYTRDAINESKANG